MTAPVDVCNEALQEIGARAAVTSISPSDGSPHANACALIYTPKIQMLLRAAHWNCARRQVDLSLLKSLYTAQQTLSTNPPPKPWWYEYALPADCLKVRFVPRVLENANPPSPPLTSSPAIFPVPQTFAGFMPFVVGLDTDSNGNLVKVILTNQPDAIGVYTADISANPDLWDASFHTGAVSTLGAYLVNPLARNAQLLQQQVASATAAVAGARAADGNEGLPTQDHMPDWLRARMVGAGSFVGPFGDCFAGWDSLELPGGIRF
jgi:hypothetical protein